MSYSPPRRPSRQICARSLPIGGGAPISVQTMTTADPHDYSALLAQVRALSDAGADLIRLTVPDVAAADVFARVRQAVALPLCADIHFDYRLAIAAAERGADKIRVNPGNIGGADRVRAVAAACAARSIPIRIGVNSGSLEKEIYARYGGICPEALVDSALGHAQLLERWDFCDICISIKSSNVPLTVAAYRLLAERCDYPLHLGVTEAGGVHMGTIKSAAGIGGLLAMGIGDTIRVSLTGDPLPEIAAGRDILRAAGADEGGLNIVSCPTCGRTKSDLSGLVSHIENATRDMAFSRKVTLAVMGCAVNGPGEAREADLGVAGCGDTPDLMLFKKGEIAGKITQSQAAERILSELTAFL